MGRWRVYNKDKIMFRPGDTVIFDSTKLNPSYWNNETESNKQLYYGSFVELDCKIAFDKMKLKLFTFITYHYPQLGHCVLMDMDTGQLLPMCHDSDFRLVTDEEC